VEDIVSPAAVICLDKKSAAEFRGFEVNVVRSEEFRDLIEKPLGTDEKGLQGKISIHDYGGKIVMVGLPLPL
jgi:hypothetical protein